VKYGVICERDFIYHLNNWDNVFIAGRFHKPVLDIEIRPNMNLYKTIDSNRESAVSIFLYMFILVFLNSFKMRH
jgi:hypothetical protein